MKFIDWFAGVGGFRKGMELAGHECVGFCEFDKYAVMSYTAMHLCTDEQLTYLATLPLKERQKEILKEEYRNGEWYANDVRTVDARCIPDADCWCFGFPCQDISVAGKQLGFTGNRSSLFFRVMYMVGQLEEEKKPTYLFIENVKNLLSVNGGWDFARLLSELDKNGYDAEWSVINSKYFGVPQNRERCYIVGHLRNRGTSEVFSVGENRETDSLLTIKQIGRLGGKNRDNPQSYRVYESYGIGSSLCTMQGGGLEQCVVIGAMRGRSDGAWNETEHEQRLELRKDGVSNTLTSSRKDNLVIQEICPNVVGGIGEKKSNGGTQFYQQDRVYDGDKIATSLSASLPGGANMYSIRVESECDANTGTEPGIYIQTPNGFSVYAIWNPLKKCYMAVRRLTPKECFRLQGWTDDYFAKAQLVNSDSQLYKQAGNGVTVNVICAIAEKMKEQEAT